MKFFVLLWVNSGLKERKEYVLQHLGKIRNQLLRLKNITETHKSIFSRLGNFKNLNYESSKFHITNSVRTLKALQEISILDA